MTGSERNILLPLQATETRAVISSMLTRLATLGLVPAVTLY